MQETEKPYQYTSKYHVPLRAVYLYTPGEAQSQSSTPQAHRKRHLCEQRNSQV